MVESSFVDRSGGTLLLATLWMTFCLAGLHCNHEPVNPCKPNCSDKECGDDGCGGSCGTCDAPETCGGGGTAYVCGDNVERCVADYTSLLEAIDGSQPGSTVQLCEGNWNDLSLSITGDGAPDRPLTIRARTQGQTVITGKSEIRIDGDYVVLDGLVFSSGEPLGQNGVIRIFGDHNRVTNTLIDGYNGVNKKWVSLEAGSQNSEIDHCRFANKDSAGSLLTVWRSDNSAQYHYIHHNHFVDYASGGGENGWESLRIGTSQWSQSDSFTTVEYNLFESCNGEIEIISVKSGNNVIRSNTFIKSDGLLTLRHGKSNTVEGNVFLQSDSSAGGGIRIYDGNHLVHNNYIAGVRTTSNARGGIVVHSGLCALGGPDPALNAQWTPFDVTISSNTIYDSTQSFLYGGNYAYPAWGIVFQNNVVYNEATYPVIREDKALDEPSYSNEHYWGSELGIAAVFGISLAPISDLYQNADGLWLSQSSGAQDVRLLLPADVGPQ